MAPRPQSSAAGVLALLSESDPLLKHHALKALVSLVPQFWAEISEHIALVCVSPRVHRRAYAHPVLPVNRFMRAQISL